MNSSNNKKNKILIATGIFPPDIGGPATYVEALYNELPKFNFEVKIVTYSDYEKSQNTNHKLQKNSKFQIANSEKNVFKISRRSNLLIRYLYYFLAVFKLCRWADVVYVQGVVSEGLPSWLACKLRGKKYILKIVGDYAWEQGSQRFGVCENTDDFQDKKYSWQVELMRWVERQVARGAARIIVPSFYLKNIIRQWGVEEEKIIVIYNAVAPAGLSSAKEQTRIDLGLQGDIILTVARLVPWKGIDALIELMPELLKDNPDFKLVIIGDGPLKNDLEKKTEYLDLLDRVIFTGRLEAGNVREYMAASDYFILNSSYEGLSHVLIEAMQSGLPVLASRAGGNPELIEHGKNGILFDYNSQAQIKAAISDLWLNKEKGGKLADEAKKSLNKFTKEVMVDKTIKVLQAIYESTKFQLGQLSPE